MSSCALASSTLERRRVLSERAITRNEIIVRARVIGGLQMIDGGEADDKIVSVLENDHVWGKARNVSDVPAMADYDEAFGRGPA